MGIKYVLFNGKDLKYAITDSGVYNLALISKEGNILIEEVEVYLSENLEYILTTVSGDELSDGFELNISSFGRLRRGSPEPKLKFVHIPKNAGTSIEDFGFFLGAKWGRVDRKYLKSVNKNFYWHSPATQTGIIYPNHDTFCVVRNPYKRLLSVVYCNLRSFVPKTAEEFNSDVVRSINRYKEDPFEHENSHWIPQYDFVYYKGEKIVDHVLRFENLNDDLHDLFSKYGIENKMTNHSNKSSKKKRFGISDLYPETLDLFNKTYAKDFDYFGYEMISTSDI